jgi:hypothetical protein
VDLKTLLGELATGFGVPGLLCMSSCNGFSAWRALKDGDVSMHGLIGTRVKPTWSETFVAFSTLYYQLNLGVPIREAVAAMKVASRHDSFDFESLGSATLRGRVMTYLGQKARKEREDAVRARLRQIMERMQQNRANDSDASSKNEQTD